MKRRLVERTLVYTATIAALLGALALATVYARASQSRIAKTQLESLNQSAKERNATTVKVCSIFRQPLTDILELPGKVEADEDIDLAAKMDGTVEWIAHEEGDVVRKGEELLQLDVAVLAAQEKRARSNHDLAKLKYDRTKRLYERGVETPDAFDGAEANLRTSEAALEEAVANLENGTLRSPIDGVLDRRHVDRGEHIAAGQTVMKIVSIDKVKVSFNIPEKDAHYFRPGGEVQLHVSSNGEPHDCTGTIDFVAMSADPLALTYPLKVIAENRNHCLLPGMIVRADLVRRSVDQGIAAPLFALLDREESKSVFVVEDGIAKERSIEYGMYQQGMVEIVNGLEVDDLLVVVGQRNLVSGQKVEIVEDLTDTAKAYLREGRDLSRLVLEGARPKPTETTETDPVDPSHPVS